MKYIMTLFRRLNSEPETDWFWRIEIYKTVNTYAFSDVYFVVLGLITVCEWICWLEVRICTNCKNIQYKIYKPFEMKMLTFIIDVC